MIALESPRWELSIAASRFVLRLVVRKLDMGGDIRPPLPANGGLRGLTYTHVTLIIES